MRKSTFLAVSLWALASATAGSSAPALADDAMTSGSAMMPAKIDCSQADAMLSNAQKMGTTTAFTGEIDRIIVPTLMEREKGTNMMLHIEAACGKDAKMKAMAAKAAADSDARMQVFQGEHPGGQ